MKEVLEYALSREEEINRAARYKEELATRITVEEMGELIQAISKNLRLKDCLEELNCKMESLDIESDLGEIDYKTYKERRLTIQDVYYAKEKEYKAARDNLAEEMGDVLITSLFWMQKVFGVEDKEIIKQLEYKINRMNTRIDEDMFF